MSDNGNTPLLVPNEKMPLNAIDNKIFGEDSDDKPLTDIISITPTNKANNALVLNDDDSDSSDFEPDFS